jgi:hypothetical protein
MAILSILLLTWPLTGPARLLMRVCDMFVEEITILTEYSGSSLTGMIFVCKVLHVACLTSFFHFVSSARTGNHVIEHR